MHLVFFRFPYKLSIEEDDNFFWQIRYFHGKDILKMARFRMTAIQSIWKICLEEILLESMQLKEEYYSIK